MQFYPNEDITTEHVHSAAVVRGYTCHEIYPADLTPEQLADIQVAPREDLLIERSDWRPNKIVNSIAILIASLFRDPSSLSGAGYMAFGTGLDEWTNPGPTPAPTGSETELETETARKSTTVIFIDSSNSSSNRPTNRLQITALLDATERVGDTFREFGLFGGDGAENANSGTMINYITHGVVTKERSVYARRVRLVF